MDLLDYYRGTLSLRRVRVMIRHLPDDSATRQAMDPRAEWSASEHLLATVVDRLGELAWLYVEGKKKKNSKNPRPKEIPRPGQDDEASGKSSGGKPPLSSGRDLAGWL